MPGAGHDRVVRVATDAHGQMLPAAFTRAVADAVTVLHPAEPTNATPGLDVLQRITSIRWS